MSPCCSKENKRLNCSLFLRMIQQQQQE